MKVLTSGLGTVIALFEASIVNFIAVILAHRQLLRGGAYLKEENVAKIRLTLQSLKETSIEKVCIVDGEHVEALKDQLSDDMTSFDLVEVFSHSGWRQASGSVLRAASPFIETHGTEASHVLVLRADRPMTTDSLHKLLDGINSKTLQLDALFGVDNPDDKLSDDECKVLFHPDKKMGLPVIEACGPDLQRAQGYLTGHAVIKKSMLMGFSEFSNPEIFEALNSSIASKNVGAVETSCDWDGESTGDVQQSIAAIIKTKQHPGYTLLNPGPVNTTARVKSAMVHHDVCHRDSNFQELMVSLTRKLKRIFKGGPKHSISIITGSGTAAMESAMTSAIPREGKVLVIDNGAFGGRMFEIAQVHEMDVVHLRYAWGDRVKVADVKSALERHPDIQTVVMTYHETSVGLLNPVKDIGAMCREYGALFLVDAVSALGAEDVDVVRDNIDVCWASANKCLHSISGAGFVCISPRAIKKISQIKPRSFYLDLKRYMTYAEEKAQTPFTPAVSTYFALDAACSEFLEDGHEKRIALYKQRNQKIRQGLSSMGIEPFTRFGCESNSVVTACVPNGVTFENLYAELKQRGFIVYGCKDVLAGQFFQVANMGDIDDSQIERFLNTLSDVVQQLRETNSESNIDVHRDMPNTAPNRQSKRLTA